MIKAKAVEREEAAAKPPMQISGRLRSLGRGVCWLLILRCFAFGLSSFTLGSGHRCCHGLGRCCGTLLLFQYGWELGGDCREDRLRRHGLQHPDDVTLLFHFRLFLHTSLL